MNRDQHTVDSALESLRSATWTGSSYNPQLEETLMQEFTKQQIAGRRRNRSTWLLAGAVVLAGGATFAATGGAALLRSWLVHVQIGDQQYQFETDENGEGTIQWETEDGNVANVHVKRVDTEDGQAQTNVRVNVTGPNSQEEKVVRLEQRKGSAPPADASAADLAGTEPTATWSTSDGRNKSVHLVTSEDGNTTMFIVTTASDGSQSIRRMAELPSKLHLAGLTPVITTSASGDTITLTYDNGSGHKQVLKFRDREVSDNSPPADGPVQVDPTNGTIRINANPPVDEE